MSSPTSVVLAQQDLPLGGDRTLRLSLVSEEHGTSVVLALGFAGAESGRPFHRPPWAGSVLALPAEVLPELRRALEELGAQ